MRSDDSADRKITDRQMLTETLLELAREPNDTGHLEHSRLLAYLRGGLSEAEEHSAQDHLASCRACATALLDLNSLAESEAACEQGPSDLAKAMAWHSFRTRLAESQRDSCRRRARFAYVAAAAMFICVVGLSVWSALRPGAGLEQPQRDVPLIYLDSASTRGGTESPVAIPPKAGFLVLIVTPSQSARSQEFRVEIKGEDGRVRWSGGGLHLSDYGALRLAVPSSFLPPGRYSVSLYESQDKGGRVLDSYSMQVPKPRE